MLLCGGKGELLLRGVRPDHLSAVLPLLEEMGCQLKTEKDTIRIVCRQPLRAVSGFPPCLTRLPDRCLSADDGSCLHRTGDDHLYRKHLSGPIQARLGAVPDGSGYQSRRQGLRWCAGALPALCAGSMYRPAWRSGAGHCSAGRPRKTVVEDIRHLLRGYEHLDRTINSLGGCIVRKTM